MTRWLRCAREGPRPTRRDHSKTTALATVLSKEHANYTSGRAPSRRWPRRQGGASEVVPTLNGAPKRALPRAAPHAHEGLRRHRLIAARRARRAGRGSCARVSVRAQSADEYEPSWAHRLPQQPTQSRLKGSRQARAEQAGARGRGTGFEGSKPAAHLSKPPKTPNSSGDPRRKRTSNHPASWVASHPGRVRFMVRISAVRSRRHAVC